MDLPPFAARTEQNCLIADDHGTGMNEKQTPLVTQGPPCGADQPRPKLLRRNPPRRRHRNFAAAAYTKPAHARHNEPAFAGGDNAFSRHRTVIRRFIERDRNVCIAGRTGVLE